MTSDEWLNFLEHPDVFAFCAKIAENPDDLAPKLVFADWLEENCPDERFVQTYRDAVTGKEYSSRDMILPDDAEPLSTITNNDQWYRSISLTESGQFKINPWHDIRRLQRLVKSGIAYYANIPLDWIDELPFPETFYSLYCWSWECEVPVNQLDFSHIRELYYRGPSLSGRKEYEILESAYLTNLKSLSLAGEGFNEDFLFRLADSPILQNVTKLAVECRNGSGIWIEAFAWSPYVQNVERLDLSGNRLGRDAIKAILDSPQLSKLAELRIRDISQPEGERQQFWEEIATNQGTNRISTLSIGSEDVTPECYSQFFRSRNFQKLDRLWMEVVGVTTESLKVFLESPSFPSLKRLGFHNNKIDDEGAIAIANAPRMRKLDDICLRLNFDITEVGWNALLESPYITPSAKVSIQEAKVELEEWGKEVESPEEPAPPEE